MVDHMMMLEKIEDIFITEQPSLHRTGRVTLDFVLYDRGRGVVTMTSEKKRPSDMINNSNLGTWMSWGDIVKTYPNRWVYITNLEKDSRGSIVGGILEVVCKDPEVDLVEDILTDRNKRGLFDRTTELPGNVLWVE